MASAADEDSWHHIFPGPYVHTIMVNAIADFGVPGVVPGIVALPERLHQLRRQPPGVGLRDLVLVGSDRTQLRHRRAHRVGGARRRRRERRSTSPLTANEIRQLFTQTADDINFDVPGGPLGTPPSVGGRRSRSPTPRATRRRRASISSRATAASTRTTPSTRVLAGRHPARGRHHARRSGSSRSIPQRDGAFAVEGRVAAERATRLHLPRPDRATASSRIEADFIDVVPFGATHTTPLDGVLATITPAQVPAPTRGPDRAPPEPAARPHLRLRPVHLHDPRPGARRRPATSSARTAARSSSTTIPTCRRRSRCAIGGDGASSPALADLDGDGAAEIVFGTSDGLVYAKRGDGTDLPGWPAAGDLLPLQSRARPPSRPARSAPPRGAILASVAIGDIDDDGLLDVVAADMEGKVYAWNHQGARKTGFPVQVNLVYSAHDVKDPHNRVDRAIIALARARRPRRRRRPRHRRRRQRPPRLRVERPRRAARRASRCWSSTRRRMASIDPVNHKVDAAARRVPRREDHELARHRRHRRRRLDRHRRRHQRVLRRADQRRALERHGGGASRSCSRPPARAPATAASTRSTRTAPTTPAGRSTPAGRCKIAFFTAEILPNVGEGINASPALADVDGNGTLEIGVFSAGGPAYLLNADGTSFYGSDPERLPRDADRGRHLDQSRHCRRSRRSARARSAISPARARAALRSRRPPPGSARLLAIVLARPAAHRRRSRRARGSRRPAPTMPTFPHHIEELQFLTGPSIADVGGAPASARRRRSSRARPATSCTPTTRAAPSRSAGRSSPAAGTSPTRPSATSTATA